MLTDAETEQSEEVQSEEAKDELLTEEWSELLRKKNHKTKIATTISQIINDPHFPEKRIEGAYPDLKDSEVEIKYQTFAKKWSGIRQEKKYGRTTVPPSEAKGLTLDDFAALTGDFLGKKGLNRDVINRVLHSGDSSVKTRHRTPNEKAIKILSNFTKDYTFDQILNMAKEAIAESKKNEAERINNPHETDPIEYPIKESGLKLHDVINRYIKKHGHDHLLSEIMKISGYEEESKAKALAFNLLSGSDPHIATVVILSRGMEIPGEKMIEIVRRSFMPNINI